MRTFPAFLLGFGLLLAGCTASTPRGTAPDDAPAALPPAGNKTLEGLRQFCESQEVCDFWDGEFHEFVVYDLDTPHIDALIVPGATADPLIHVEAMRQAVVAWGEGVKELGAPWFTSNFTLDTYVIGKDVPPPEALSDPEIIVVAAGASKTLVGIGLEPKQIACIIAGGESPAHVHDGWELQRMDCTGTGFTCVALNVAGGMGAERDLYDLVAHEVGHCLGAGHVGDALDFSARYAPVEDIMSYQSNATQVHCVSNLNVRVLEGVYGHLLGRPDDQLLPRGSFYAMPPHEYMQVSCKNP